MVTAFNILYSISAAFRILTERLKAWGKVACVKKLLKMKNGCFNAVYVIRFGDRLFRWAVFISRSVFQKHFVERRQAEAKKMRIEFSDLPNVYRVKNPEKGSSYNIFAAEKALYCNCEDYNNQSKFFTGKPALCKHGWAVLKWLGFETLEAYIDSGGLDF